MTHESLRDRSVLVTGGTGTIGSEIVRQLLAASPRVVRILTRDETKQAELREELGVEPRVRFLIGDVRDLERLRCALEGVDLVFHAAALKHVPACEYNPFEAVQTNVVGTENLVRASRETGVNRLVYISTDKAVNPVNTMGATKLLAENLIRASQEWNPDLVMSVVRFGNVLGSRGSLLPLLRARIDAGVPVELTSREMTRFMMTIEDAVSLVLEAERTAKAGELSVLKMPALRVEDLVDVFIRMYCERTGRNPDRVIVRETGARPGEKIHEELLTADEYSRVVETDRLYRVLPGSSGPAQTQRPAALCSERAKLLDRAEVEQLIHRSGYLERLGLAPSTSEAEAGSEETVR